MRPSLLPMSPPSLVPPCTLPLLLPYTPLPSPSSPSLFQGSLSLSCLPPHYPRRVKVAPGSHKVTARTRPTKHRFYLHYHKRRRSAQTLPETSPCPSVPGGGVGGGGKERLESQGRGEEEGKSGRVPWALAFPSLRAAPSKPEGFADRNL